MSPSASMTTSEYASHREVSDSYIRRMRRTGALVLTDGERIDVRASDARLDEMLHPLRGGKRGPTAGDNGPPAPTTTPDSPIPVHEAVRRERLARARMAELELGEHAAQLTRVDDVNRVVFTLVRQALNQLQGISGRLRKPLAAETDPFKVAALIDADIHGICREMRKAAASLLDTRHSLTIAEDTADNADDGTDEADQDGADDAP